MRYGPLLPIVLLSGCSVFSPTPNTVNLENVLSRIKIELGMYEKYELAAAKENPLNNACGGYVNFHVTSAQLTLTVAHNTKTEIDPKIGLPVPLPATLSVNASGSSTRKGTQTLVLNVYPAPNTGINDLPASTDTPLADALIGLRKAMLADSDRQPCVYLRQDNSAVKNTLSFAMEIDTSVGEGINFGYTIFGLTGSHSDETDQTNKIQITFEPYLDPSDAKGKPPKTPVAPPGQHREGFSEIHRPGRRRFRCQLRHSDYPTDRERLALNQMQPTRKTTLETRLQNNCSEPLRSNSRPYSQALEQHRRRQYS